MILIRVGLTTGDLYYIYMYVPAPDSGRNGKSVMVVDIFYPAGGGPPWGYPLNCKAFLAMMMMTNIWILTHGHHVLMDVVNGAQIWQREEKFGRRTGGRGWGG